MNSLSLWARAVLNFLLLTILFAAFARGQSLVQLNAKLPSSGAQVAVVYASAQTAGNLNVVIVGWSDSTATVSTVTDTKGNVYTQAVGPIVVPGAVSQSIYYAKNIAGAAAGGNTVMVKFSTTASYPDVRILEYSGLDVNTPLDGGMGAVGSATTSDSGALVTTNGSDLLVGANTVLTSTTAAGAGYTNRIITDPDGDLAEDKVVTAVGTYHATATLSSGGSWVMEVVAFKAAGAAPAPTAPGNLVATPVSTSQINLTWTASTETGGTVSSYLVERCAGAGCTNFAQVGTTGTTSYSDTGLASGTSYSYRVRGQDTANSVGPYSNTATGITQGTAVPTAPGNLTGIAGASGPIVVGTQGYINATSQPAHTTNAFDSTGGDLLVICVSSHGGVTMTPSDSYGNSWILGSGPTSTTVGFDLRTGVWYARNPTVGAGHTVTVNLSAAQPVVISVFVVKGSNIATPIDAISAIGSDGGTETESVSSPSIATTTGYDLLIGFAKSSINEVWTAGAGYTAQPTASSAYLNAETGQAVTPGSYAATFGINGAATWQAAAVAVSPSAVASSPSQVNLTWTASTETGGTISSYLVERCQGTGCTSFTQIGTSTNTTFNDTNVSPGTTYTYRVRAVDAFNDVGPYSNTASVSIGGAPVPTAPSNLSATALSATAVSLSWTAALEAGGTISSYLVERCQGSACTSFAQIGTSASTTYTNSSLSASTIYNYRVRAEDATNSLGPYSNVATATTAGVPTILSLSPTSGGIGTVVTIAGTNFGTGFPSVTFNNTISVPTSQNPTTIVVPVPSGATTGNVVVTVGGVASNGVTFVVLPISVSVSPSTATVSTGGQLSLTATEQNVPPFSDVTWSLSGAGCAGTACGIVTPSNARPLAATYTPPIILPNPSTVVVTATSQADSTKSAASTIFLVQTPAPTISGLNPSSGPIGTQVTIAGTNFGATQGSNFVSTSAGSAPVNSWSDTSIVVTIPTSLAGFANALISVSVNQLSSNQANFGIISTPNISSINPASGPIATLTTITGTNFGAAQSTSTVTFNGIQAATASWSPTSIKAFVPSGVVAGPASVVVTVGGQASNGVVFNVSIPTAPANLTATAASSTQINLSWTAATESGGTISSYLVERCQTAGCSNFVQVGTSTTTTFSDTGLTGSTSYSYRVRASDALSNLGPYSTIATASTPAATPTAPTNLTATAASNVQINLSWTASTETGGTIATYLVERCQGSSCTNFVQVGTSTTNTYASVGLTGSTTYRFRVRAQDTLNNTGPYSSIAAATTSAPTITAPLSLTATVISAVQINLSWAAATETGGTISNYLVERCQSVSCTTFAQIGTSATLTFNNTGLTGSTSYSYRVRATDAAGDLGAYSPTATALTAAPTITAPSNLKATAASNTQINLSWTAATETGGTISTYLVERCQGAACTNFAQVGTSTTTSLNDTGLTASTSYSYRVRARDAANNMGPYSNTASVTTLASAPPPPTINLAQLNAGLPSSGATVSVVYASAQTAGNLNVVIVGWSDSTATVSTVTDTKGNVYTQAVGPIVVPGAVSQSIYYAKNIAGAAAGGNTVTVKFSTTASYPDVRILEYSGLDVNTPLDGGMGAVGSAATSDSGALVTTNANDLLVGANTVLTGNRTAGTGYTNRMITDPDGDLVEDRVVTAVGTYHATATLSSGGSWVMEVVAFKGAGAAPAPTAPGNLVVTPVSTAQINLTWTASTETGGTVSSYLVERCVGAGCTNFTQVGTTGTTSYSDTGLASGTSYSYRVRGQDTANSLGPYSNTATGITQGTAVPTAPGNLTGIAGASGPIVVGTQGYINATSQPAHTTGAFDSTGGDLLVICVSSHGGVTMTPSDSYGNSWILGSGPTSTTVGFDLRTGVWYARNPTVGVGHTVTVNLSAAQPVVISVFVVKGSNIATPIDTVSAIGSDGGTQTESVSSPSITTTNGYDLLIGFAKSSINEVWTAGAGYTAQPTASSAYLNAETGQAVTPGSYAATFGINGAATWQAAVVAVSPSAAAASPSQVNLTWTASTEAGGTIGMYLVERCQGAGCTSFTQIGTSTNTTFNDNTVSSATTYIYRVRAKDISNGLGPYSTTATVAMP